MLSPLQLEALLQSEALWERIQRMADGEEEMTVEQLTVCVTTVLDLIRAAVAEDG